MFTRPFHADRFLGSVWGTDPFRDYCRRRDISFNHALDAPMGMGASRRWASALAKLPLARQAEVEAELVMVNEMAGDEEVAHLVEVADDGDLPPDSVPGGTPLALWFLLHRPTLFHDVFHHHEVHEFATWRTGRAEPRLDGRDLKARSTALGETLKEFFRLREGTGRFCAVETYRLARAYCFMGQVADRPQLVDVFTEDGRTARHQLRPALQVVFVYYPGDGMVLVKSHLYSWDRTAELLQRFGKAVLGAPVQCDHNAFRLDRLKQPFHPLPDALDMEMVQVRVLHLRYPEGLGRQQLTLTTLANDEPTAMDDLLRAHVSDDAFTDLRVVHAELQIRMRIKNHSKSFPIRLWPNRCDVGRGPVADRFFACLRRWGL